MFCYYGHTVTKARFVKAYQDTMYKPFFHIDSSFSTLNSLLSSSIEPSSSVQGNQLTALEAPEVHSGSLGDVVRLSSALLLFFFLPFSRSAHAPPTLHHLHLHQPVLNPLLPPDKCQNIIFAWICGNNNNNNSSNVNNNKKQQMENGKQKTAACCLSQRCQRR